MSLITDDPEQQSPRDCSRSGKRRHHHNHGRRRRALIAVSSAVASLLSLSLILWLTLRPSSPRFSLLAATVTAKVVLDNDNKKNGIITVVDAALSAHNPNAHAAALYDELRASASYGGVPLRAGAPLPPWEQPEQGDAVLSALLTSSPSPPSLPSPSSVLRVRIEGQLRWKVAAWVSARHGLTVECVAAVQVPVLPSSSSSAGGQQQQLGSSSSPTECATQVL